MKTKLPKIVFYTAGIYGLIVLLPLYFLEEKIGRDYPPPITHPEYYYGSVGVALAFQILFLMIARRPSRLRAAMIPAIIEKLSFGAAVIVLFLQNRLALLPFTAGIFDLFLGVLFVIAYFQTDPD